MNKTHMIEKCIEAFVHLAKEQTKDSEFEKMTKRIQLVGKEITNHSRLPYTLIKVLRVIAKHMETDGSRFASLIIALRKVASKHIAVFLSNLPEKEKQEMEELINEIMELHL